MKYKSVFNTLIKSVHQLPTTFNYYCKSTFFNLEATISQQNNYNKLKAP